jgi:hypothetical protein
VSGLGDRLGQANFSHLSSSRLEKVISYGKTVQCHAKFCPHSLLSNLLLSAFVEMMTIDGRFHFEKREIRDLASLNVRRALAEGKNGKRI